ncbi:hypothetical protein [Rhodoferax sp.]|uniref:hypothetical protein n=1 Tax=Rhodoferax sp. TaxID=50421 RepID=UPI00374D7488
MAPTTEGVIVNSYIYGAVVTLDANDDGVCGSTEPKVVSSMTGAFSFPGLGDHMVCSIGGYNTATNLPMMGELRAAAGSPVITPLTTLMVSQLPPHPTSADIATAQGNIEKQLSLPAGSLSLDPVTAIASNPKIEQTNAAVQAMLATASESVAAFAGIAKPTDASTATQKADYQSAVNLVFSNAAKAVATSLAAAPAPVDLTDSSKSAATTTFVGNVVQSTITAVNTAAAATGGTNATATLLKAAAPAAAATLAKTSPVNAAAFVAASISASVQSVAQIAPSTDAAANKAAIAASETKAQSNTSIVNLVASVQINAPTLFAASATAAPAEMATLSQVLLPSASVVANTVYTAPTSAVNDALTTVVAAAKVTSITTASITALQAAVVATPAAPTQVDLTKVVLPTTPALPAPQVLTGAGA